MEYFDYTNLEDFLADEDIIDALNIKKPIEKLVAYYCTDEILEIREGMRIPFFAEIRNYIGAVEKENPSEKWLIKPVDDEKTQKQTEIATICYFIDHMTRTPSAPSIITKIDGRTYKATKMIARSEQLSGANYMEIRELKEQLLLDLINRWIYYDEDRNPNNYVIRYNSKNNQIVIPIDFLNSDLLYKGMKIKGNDESFGWSRLEKTRYLTPLKIENFLIYDMKFFNMRFDYFNSLDMRKLQEMCRVVLRHNPDKNELAQNITDNIKHRVDYVYEYFNKHFPYERVHDDEDKYNDMGEAFKNIYNKFD
ncbi:hypothetical protein WKV44_06260 [Spirochaetia bacterium 38H-sp]|uniref:Uncharacterized protein n=1 Tax=Rarispira pelagica TaxID=3141764 RepID=A0ABU9UBU2_9SPIR